MAVLGLGSGVFQSGGKMSIKGFFAWLIHRGYHGMAIPSWERKLRVFWGWAAAFWLGRDIASISDREFPKQNFLMFNKYSKPPNNPKVVDDKLKVN